FLLVGSVYGSAFGYKKLADVFSALARGLVKRRPAEPVFCSKIGTGGYEYFYGIDVPVPGGVVKRRPLEFILSHGQVGAGFEENPDDPVISVNGGAVERRFPRPIPGIHRCARFDEELYDFFLTGFGCIEKRRPVELVPDYDKAGAERIDVGPILDKNFGNFKSSVPRGEVQRRAAVMLRQVYVGARVKEKPGNILVALEDREMERPDTTVTIRVDVSAVFDQEFNDGQMTVDGRKVKRHIT
ncbi:unnamed protein product, partial [marine sediment metagenome]